VNDRAFAKAPARRWQSSVLLLVLLDA